MECSPHIDQTLTTAFVPLLCNALTDELTLGYDYFLALCCLNRNNADFVLLVYYVTHWQRIYRHIR